jgi:hypothetical protein
MAGWLALLHNVSLSYAGTLCVSTYRTTTTATTILRAF